MQIREVRHKIWETIAERETHGNSNIFATPMTLSTSSQPHFAKVALREWDARKERIEVSFDAVSDLNPERWAGDSVKLVMPSQSPSHQFLMLWHLHYLWHLGRLKIEIRDTVWKLPWFPHWRSTQEEDSAPWTNTILSSYHPPRFCLCLVLCDGELSLPFKKFVLEGSDASDGTSRSAVSSLAISPPDLNNLSSWCED